MAMATPLNVAFHRNFDPECHCLQKPYIFSYPFPTCRPECDRLNDLFSTLPIFLKPSALETLRIRLVMATSFSAITWNDSSVINLVHRNDARISMPTLIFSHSRWELAKFLPQFHTKSLLIVSKKPPKKPVSLHPETLAPPNLRAIGGLLLLWFAVDKLIRRQTESYWRCFLTHVFFELVGSHITTLFNKPIHEKAVITTDGEFALDCLLLANTERYIGRGCSRRCLGKSLHRFVESNTWIIGPCTQVGSKLFLYVADPQSLLSSQAPMHRLTNLLRCLRPFAAKSVPNSCC